MIKINLLQRIIRGHEFILHIIIQTRVPNMLTKINCEDKPFTLTNVNPTSPVFDNAIFEQFRELVSITNLEIIFGTIDFNLARISEQSGISAIYLEQPLHVPKNIEFNQRKLLWTFLSMLYKFDKVEIKTDTLNEAWIMVKNSRGEKSNIYYKKNDNNYKYYTLQVKNNIF